MGRYNVQFDNKWACFSTVVDNFITEFMSKEEYQQWRIEEYGRQAGKLSESLQKNIWDCIGDIRLNRTYFETKTILMEMGVDPAYGEIIEIENYTPRKSGDLYQCPNCGSFVNYKQERCIDESCFIEFYWVPWIQRKEKNLHDQPIQTLEE